ncbi:NAD-dependent epimerase/dehydratase family protein [Neolewinella antarctica]|uniref:Nucleoside-diphosphate-sugar epimerase n=1 Tax=Neolewinella antarctica TaxID=442734 RepID=A0ABX0XDW8_9BACT|nr:NAD-dependent epimerase/dehydratase family protein [Neolewinella antarctica]NJC27089.1 nucleoside-diphosphate-sugar epimerase [Neolewinella antarctica]
MLLLTGATGFLGQHLTRELQNRNIPFQALSRRALSPQLSRARSQVHGEGEKSIDWVPGDVNDPESLVEAFTGITTVIHAAAKVSFQYEDRDELLLVNGEGTANVVNAALEAGVRHVVYVSSVSVLNRAPDGPVVTLADRWPAERPNSAYAESKFDAEREIWRGQAEGLSVSVVYPSTIIGPGDFNGSNTPSLWRHAAKERGFYPTGRAGFVAVHDVVDAILYLADQREDGQRLLLNAANLTWKDFLERSAASIGAAPPTRSMPAWQSAFLWPVDKVRTMVTGQKPIITRETHRSTQSDFRYNGSSYESALGKPYRDIYDTIKRVGEAYSRLN